MTMPLKRATSIQELPVGTRVSITFLSWSDSPTYTGTIVAWGMYGDDLAPVFQSEQLDDRFHDCEGLVPDDYGYWIDDWELKSKDVRIICKVERKKSGFGQFINRIEVPTCVG